MFIVEKNSYDYKTLSLSRFIANMTNAFTTAFGTASSSATLPVTIRLLEEKNGVDPRIARYNKALIERRDRFCKASNFFIKKKNGQLFASNSGYDSYS